MPPLSHFPVVPDLGSLFASRLYLFSYHILGAQLVLLLPPGFAGRPPRSALHRPSPAVGGPTQGLPWWAPVTSPAGSPGPPFLVSLFPASGVFHTLPLLLLVQFASSRGQAGQGPTALRVLRLPSPSRMAPRLLQDPVLLGRRFLLLSVVRGLGPCPLVPGLLYRMCCVAFAEFLPFSLLPGPACSASP